MAATVEGLFKIIDGASGPMQRMERQAKKTDSSIESLGERLDNVGSDKQLKQMDSVDRNIRNIDRDARTFSGGSGGGGRLRSTLRGAGGDADNLSSKLVKVGLSLASVGKIFQALKLPLIVSGVVALVQGISALGGGLVALMPKLLDVAGVAGALPALITGVGIAAVSAKLALGGLGPALKGTKGAMADLTPRAREFVRVMKELKPLGQSLRGSAQAGLFPGLTNALGSLKQGAPTARRLLKRGGETLGGIAERGANQFTQAGFLRDFESIGNQGLGIVNKMGSGLLNIAQALRHVAVAAQPFTDWLADTLLGWTEFWKQSALAGRRTGELASYFDRTRASLETFGSILHNLWDTFKGLGAAARPLGEDLWTSADKATERWARFTNSVTGRHELRQYFNSLSDNIHAIFEFTAELGGAFVKLGSSGGFTSTMKALTRAVEPLGHLMETLGTRWGPALAKTLEQLVRLFDNLGGGTFVIAALVESVNMLLEGINSLLEKIPGLSNLIVGILGVAALSGLAGRIRGIAQSWGLVAASAGQAAVAQRAAVMGGAGGVGGFIPIGAGPGARGRVAGSTYGLARSFGYGRAASTVAQGGALLGAAGSRMGGFAKGLGATSLLFGAMQGLSTPGDLQTRTTAALSGATFGLIPARRSKEEIAAAGSAQANEWASGLMGPGRVQGIGGWTNKIGKAQGKLADLRGRGFGWKGSLPGGSILGAQAEEERAQNAVFISQLEKQVELWRKIRSAKSKALGAKEGQEFQGAFGVYRKHGMSPLEALTKTLDDVPKKMRGMNDKSQQELLRTTSTWARALAKGNPKMMAEVDKLEQGITRSFDRSGKHVEIVNGRIMRGTQSEWKGIRTAMTDEAEKARQEVSTSFTKLQQQAVGSLVAMGYTQAQARKIIGGADASPGSLNKGQGNAPNYGAGKGGGGKGGGFTHAYGGYRVGGFGNQDRYSLGGRDVGAAGELVVNKHTERDANSILGRYGMTLGGMVGKEGRPHSELSYARGGRRTTASGGGMASVGAMATGMGLSVGEGPGYGGVPSSGHASGSLHYSGLAYDVSGAPGSMMQFRRAAEQAYLGRGLNELFYDPFSYYIDGGAKVPGAIGDHSDHVHIGFFPGGPNGAAAVKGLMGGMGGFKAVKAPKSKLGGVPGAMSNAATAGLASGLNKKLASKAGVSASGARMPGMSPGGTLGMPQLQKLAAAAGMANPHLMAAIAMAESSGNPSVTNSIGARGLWQIIPSTAAAFGLNYGRLTDPAYNAFGAAKILKGQGLGAWEGYTNGAYSQFMARGGRTGGPSFAGWFGQGGTVTASSPTLMGIGDGPGTEVATVRPKGGGRAGAAGGGVKTGPITIHNHRPGDIKKQLKQEVEEAFNELADELDLQPDTDDAEVLG